MRLTVFAIVMASLVLPACTATKTFVNDAEAAVKAIPRPHFVVLDPEPYPAGAEGLVAYCKAIKLRFNYGRDMVGNGNILLSQGKKMVSDGAFKIRSGEDKVIAAETALSKARRDLSLKLGDVRAETYDFELLNDPSRFSRIQNNLDNGLRMMVRGKEIIEKGESEVSEGRAKIDEGIASIREGQAAMQDDEGRCANVRGTL